VRACDGPGPEPLDLLGGHRIEPASRQRSRRLEGDPWSAATTLGELAGLLDDGTGRGAVFEAGADGDSWRMEMGDVASRGPWKVPSPRGGAVAEVSLERWLVDNLRGPDRTGYLPLALDGSGRAHALVTAAAGGVPPRRGVPADSRSHRH